MDVITQGVLGAAAAGAVRNKPLGRMALLIGAGAGAFPDIDTALEPISDPALPWQWHRHFTHALVFIPIAGLLSTIPFFIFPKMRAKAWLAIAAGIIGAATHGLLDTCTSFGTHLLWPFTNDRAAWDIISIIDPVCEVPFWLLMLVALIIGKAWMSRVALGWFVFYLSLGFIQHERAQHVQQQLAEARGHDIERGRVMPTFGNIIVWRSIYEHDGRLYADAIRAPAFREPTVRQGEESIALVRADDLTEFDRLSPRQEFVLRNFAHFADNYLAWHPEHPWFLGDMRYSIDASSFQPIWGIAFDNAIIPPDVRWGRPLRPDQSRVARVLDEVREGGHEFVTISTIVNDPPFSGRSSGDSETMEGDAEAGGG